MINRRTYRPSKAVENLQQLSLNNSAGIDCSKQHNDVKSVYSATNLIVNTDGSLSLRKPVILNKKYDTNVIRVIPVSKDVNILIGTFSDERLFDEDGHSTANRLNQNIGFVLANSDGYIPFKFIWHDVFDNERVNNVPAGVAIPRYKLDLSECTFTNTASGIVLGNCMLHDSFTIRYDNATTVFDNVKKFPGTRADTLGTTYYNVVDASLYDGTNSWKRMLNVVYDSELNSWSMTLQIPTPNEYRATDDDAQNDLNTLLDNPFATRDSYHTAIPSIKKIRAYAYTSENNGKVTVAPSNPVNRYYSDVHFEKNIGVQSSITESNPPYSRARHSIANTTTETVTNDFLKITTVVKTDFIFDVHHRDYGEFRDYIDDVNTAVGGALSCYITRTYELSDSIKASYGTNGPDNFIFTVVPKAFVNLRLTVNGHYLSNTGDWYFEASPLTKTWSELYNEGYTVTWDLTPAITYLLDTDNANFDSTHLSEACGENPSKIYLYKKYDYTCKHLVSYSNGAETPTGGLSVQELTESVKNTRYRAATYLNFNNLNAVILKSFLGIPDNVDDVYCSWRYTTDGVTWLDALDSETGYPQVIEASQDPIQNVETTTTDTHSYTYIPLRDANRLNESFTDTSNVNNTGLSFKNAVRTRGDCLILTAVDNAWNAKAFCFKMATLKTNNNTYSVDANYGTAYFYDIVGAITEFENSDIANVASGKLLYNNSKLYSFGNSLKSTVFYSYPDEFNFPIKNALELKSGAATEVTSLVRWRDYIVGATERALYLSSVQSDGAYTKTVNTALGIPKDDGNCCVPILNGILFKSGTKVYQLYPNVYSGDATTLNVTEISQPVAHYLENYTPSTTIKPFAFSTEKEYILMLPTIDKTQCLRYNYVTRVWTNHVYDVSFYDFRIESLEDIRLWGKYNGCICEYLFDADIYKLQFNANITHDNIASLPYGDVIDVGAFTDAVSALETYFGSGYVYHCITPIAFEVDTGQKTDTILTTKQFVETKTVVATVNNYDAFPMQLTIHIDGDPHITTVDIATDAPFWKTSSTDGILNTNFQFSANTDAFNTLRQLIVRYSGKGKSIRHILSGTSLCNFKIYETYVRYKNLNVKQ